MSTLKSACVPVMLLVIALASVPRAATRPPGAVWDSVARVLQSPDVFNGGYHRFNLPRRDLGLEIGGVKLAPELALGAWAGFSDDPGDAMMMGDLVLTTRELRPVLAELARQGLDVTAIHNHLAGEEPRLVYVHIHGHGEATALAKRLDRVVALTATPRPVTAVAAAPLAIDTALVFRGLGHSGKAHGAVAKLHALRAPKANRARVRAMLSAYDQLLRDVDAELAAAKRHDLATIRRLDASTRAAAAQGDAIAAQLGATSCSGPN